MFVGKMMIVAVLILLSSSAFVCLQGSVFAVLPSFDPQSGNTQSGTSERRIEFTTNEGTWMSLDASPDGRTLVFELLGDIYALPVEGGRARPLLTGSPFQSQPRYSPDGARLAFISDESGSDNVWIANADGTGARQLSQVPRAGMLSPAWSADGAAIFVTVITPWTTNIAELWRYEIGRAHV